MKTFKRSVRIESDSLGQLEIPERAYYGIQSLRASLNYPISGLRVTPIFIRAYAFLKRACLHANHELGAFPDVATVGFIEQACNEVIEGKLEDQFIVDVFQAGAGTSTNMNLNEVIANRALELSGSPRGAYTTISPNDHVNMSQSTNDTYPTAMRISALLSIRQSLFPALEDLENAFSGKMEEFKSTLKIGRTHLQDAVPMMLGDEFGAWASIVQRHTARLHEAEKDLTFVGIGGSAVGTGLNVPPGFREKVIDILNADLDLELRGSSDMFEAMESLAPFQHVISAIKNLALDIIKISGDLRLLSSGPLTGLAEINLPSVQPGSSIMPGKVNPSVLEMASQVAMQVIGAETVISLASQAGQLELNVMMPVVQFNLLFTIEIFSNALRVLATSCIAGITANDDRMLHYAESSASLVTALAPHIGYMESAKIAKEALASKRTIRSIVLEKKLMTEDQLNSILDLNAMTRPHQLEG